MFFLEGPNCHSGLEVCQSDSGQQLHYQFFSSAVRLAFSLSLELVEDAGNEGKQLAALYQFEDIAKRLIESAYEQIVSWITACLLQSL